MENKTIEIINTDTFLQKLLGLIPYKTFDRHKLIFFRNCRAIHTFFMRFPIDVIFVDENNDIIKLTENLHPWKHSIAGRNTKNVYETSSGFIKKFNLNLGDNLIKKINLPRQVWKGTGRTNIKKLKKTIFRSSGNE